MEKIKSIFQNHKQEITLGLIAILIASFGFGLGYLLAKENRPAPIIIEKNSR